MPIQIPVGAEDQFKGVVDLVDDEGASSGATRRWAPSTTIVEIPADLMEKAKEYREKMIEAICRVRRRAVREVHRRQADHRTTRSRAGIRKAPSRMKIFPVICGTAFKNKGVQTMLDAVVDYLPSPLDVPPVEGHRRRRSGRRS